MAPLKWRVHDFYAKEWPRLQARLSANWLLTGWLVLHTSMAAQTLIAVGGSDDSMPGDNLILLLFCLPGLCGSQFSGITLEGPVYSMRPGNTGDGAPTETWWLLLLLRYHQFIDATVRFVSRYAAQSTNPPIRDHPAFINKRELTPTIYSAWVKYRRETVVMQKHDTIEWDNYRGIANDISFVHRYP